MTKNAALAAPHSAPSDAELRADYLDLLARAVCNYLYLGGQLDESSYPVRDELFNEQGWQVPEAARPHTGLRLAQLANLHKLTQDILARGVPGDFLEAGVWQGGVIIFLAGMLRAYGVEGVRVWAVDSFAGIPREPHPDDVHDPVDAWTDRWAAGLGRVQGNIRRYGLLDERIQFVCGPFREAIPRARIGRLALVRIDADAYTSTRDALQLLYPKVSPGGHVIVDDWHLDGCRRAVMDFRSEHRVVAPIQGVYLDRDGEDGEPYEVFWTV